MARAVAIVPSEKRLAAALQHRFFLRLHMAAILTGTLLAGLLVTRILYLAHLNLFAVRYGIAVIAAYAAFVGLIKVWLGYIEFCAGRDRRRTAAAASSAATSDNWFDSFTFSGTGGGPSLGSGGSPAGALSSGGGRFGGGGAIGSWGDGGGNDSNVPALAAANVSSSSTSAPHPWWKGGGGGKGGSDDLGELMLVVLIIALVVAVVASFVWIVWAAPGILSEAAFNAALAGALVRHAHTATHGQWVGSVLRKTAIPFALVLIVSIALGWYAQRYCPGAARLADAVHCAVPAQ